MTQLGVFRDTFYNATGVLPQNQYAVNAATAATLLPAAQLAGATEVYINLTSIAAAATVTTDTAANIIARLQNAVAALAAAAGQAGVSNYDGNPPGVPNLLNVSYYLSIINQSAFLVTLAAGAGVTLGTGTNNVAAASSRGYLITVTGPASVTIQTVGSGTL